MAFKLHGSKRTTVAFFAIGAAMVVACIVWAAIQAQSVAGTTRIDGTVVGGNRVEFVVDGETYAAKLPSSRGARSYHQGERVTVAYNTERPADAKVADFNSLYLGPVCVGGFGLLIVALMVWSVLHGRRRTALRAELEQHGEQLWVPVTQIAVRNRTDVETNKPSVYWLEMSWTDATGRTYTARSDYLDEDPRPTLATRTAVRVLYDRVDPARNVVDVYGETTA